MNGKKNLTVRVIKDKGDNNIVRFNKDGERLLLSQPMRLCIVGKTGAGKTNMLVQLLTEKKYFGDTYIGRNMYIFSPMVNDFKMEYLVEKKKIPDMNIYTEFDNGILGALYDKLTEEYESEMFIHKKVTPKIIIFDDLSFSGALKKGLYNNVNRIFMNGRKHMISTIITSQHYTHISSSARSNSSGLILYNMSDRQLDTISDENNYLRNKKSFKFMVREHLKEARDFIMVNYDNTRDEGLYLDSNFEKIPEEDYEI